MILHTASARGQCTRVVHAGFGWLLQPRRTRAPRRSPGVSAVWAGCLQGPRCRASGTATSRSPRTTHSRGHALCCLIVLRLYLCAAARLLGVGIYNHGECSDRAPPWPAAAAAARCSAAGRPAAPAAPTLPFRRRRVPQARRLRQRRLLLLSFRMHRRAAQRSVVPSHLPPPPPPRHRIPTTTTTTAARNRHRLTGPTPAARCWHGARTSRRAGLTQRRAMTLRSAAIVPPAGAAGRHCRRRPSFAACCLGRKAGCPAAE